MIQVGIVMGSNSDWPVMEHAARFLQQFGVGYEARVVSAHRTPDLMFEYAHSARERGIKAIGFDFPRTDLPRTQLGAATGIVITV